MNVNYFKNIKEISSYSFDTTIQLDNVEGETYLIGNECSIEITNTKEHVAVYNRSELLKELVKLGKYYYETLKPKIDFYVKYANEESVKQNSIPFDYIEKLPYIYNFEEIKKQVAESVQKWCQLYGAPFKIIQAEHKDKVCEILLNEDIRIFVSKVIIIYCLYSINALIQNIDNLLLGEDYENANCKIKKLQKFANKNIVKILDLEPNVNYFNIQTYLENVNIFKSNMMDIINLYNGSFQGNLTSYLYYDKSKGEYFNISVSDDITNLAWSELISTIVEHNSNIAKRKCAYCGVEFTVDEDINKPGPKTKYCSKHRNRSSSLRDKQNRMYKENLRKLLHNKKLDINLKNEINDLLSYSDRRFPKTRYKKLLNEMHSL